MKSNKSNKTKKTTFSKLKTWFKIVFKLNLVVDFLAKTFNDLQEHKVDMLVHISDIDSRLRNIEKFVNHVHAKEVEKELKQALETLEESMVKSVSKSKKSKKVTNKKK